MTYFVQSDGRVSVAWELSTHRVPTLTSRAEVREIGANFGEEILTQMTLSLSSDARLLGSKELVFNTR
jgi:hypothetical protein